jgi:Lipoprotein LpqB beta-propeller domain/Sporulation and spore germination
MAMVAAVAGCASMPDGGPVGAYGGNQGNNAPAQQDSGLFVSGPGSHWKPWEIVQGFVDASASYPTDPTIADEYLVGSAARTWDPGSVVVFSQLTVPPKAQTIRPSRHRPEQAYVTTTGTVQATFARSGQYVLAPVQGQGLPAGSYRFKLVQVDGQWRISNPPSYRLVSATVFPRVYQARDLYFVNPGDNVLVPDSVFVPAGTSPEDLAKNLVEALSQQPSTAWLHNGADTEFPAKTKVLNVVLDGPTAVVDLAGAAVAKADPGKLALISAQLVWTLVGSQAGPPPAIQSVELMINGKVAGTLPSRCGAGQTQSPQKLTSYECLAPYRSASARFYYANQGLAWSRCGSDREAQQVGVMVPVVSRTGTLNSQQASACGQLEPIQSTSPPLGQPNSLPAMSMAAVSPDGKYLALLSPNQNAVYVGPLSGGAASFPDVSRIPGSDINALSWGDNYLWVAQGGNFWALNADSGYKPESVVDQFTSGPITDFSIAPDGVRVAAIVQAGSGSELELAAIKPLNLTGQQPKTSVVPFSIGPDVQLAPNLTNPIALTWYDADDLIVLEEAKGGNTLWQVPVDGQQATLLPATPPGVVSITADNAANYLVAGLAGGGLEVSAGLDGTWQELTAKGQNPVYPG